MARRILDDRIELEDFVFSELGTGNIESNSFTLLADDYNSQCLNPGYGSTYTLAVVGINQQTGNTEMVAYTAGGATYTPAAWPDGYYKIEIRQYLTSGGTALSHIVGPGEYTNCHTKTMYWNKSPLRCMTYIAPEIMMGSPVGEYGRLLLRWSAELLHKVTLSKQCTQRTQLTIQEFGLLMAKIDGRLFTDMTEDILETVL